MNCDAAIHTHRHTLTPHPSPGARGACGEAGPAEPASLAAVQVAAVAVLSFHNQFDGPFNWASLLGFVVSASLLSVLASTLSRRDLRLLKSLSGLLPMCAGCKKIRDDSGSWQDVAVYIRDHSAAELSHGMCPDCAQRLFPQYYKNGRPVG